MRFRLLVLVNLLVVFCHFVGADEDSIGESISLLNESEAESIRDRIFGLIDELDGANKTAADPQQRRATELLLEKQTKHLVEMVLEEFADEPMETRIDKLERAKKYVCKGENGVCLSVFDEEISLLEEMRQRLMKHSGRISPILLKSIVQKFQVRACRGHKRADGSCEPVEEHEEEE